MPGYQPRLTTDHVWFDGVDLHTYDLATGLGTRITEIRGWDERVDVRDVREPRHGQHGEHADNVFLGGRTIPISGVVHGSSWEDLQARKRALMASLIPQSSESLLKIPDPTATAFDELWDTTVIDSAPVAWWPLDELSGSVIDNIAARNGTVTGNPSRNQPSPIPSKAEGCIDLDGDDHITVAYAAALNPAQFTVAGWVRRDADSGGTEIIAQSRNGTGLAGWALLVSSADKAVLRLGDGAAASDTTSTTSLNAGTQTWYHLAVTYNGTTASIYVNGVLEASGADSYSANTTGALTIGASATPNNYFTGRLSNLAVWNRALTAGEVAAFYEIGLYDPAEYREEAMYSYERASARVIESVMFGDMIGTAAMTFQVILRASDPRIYSDVETSTDSGTTGSAARTVTVDQTGTFPTPTTLTVTGPASTWQIDDGDDLLLALPLTLSASEQAIINTLDRTIDYVTTYERSRTIRPSIVALWMLDESAGTTADNNQGTAAYDGTYTGGYTLDQAGFDTGIGSVALNGTTGYIAIPNQSALYPSALTWEGSVYFSSVSGTRTIVDGITSNRGWRLQMLAGNQLQVTIANGAFTSSVTVDVPFTTNTWYHLVVQFDTSSLAAVVWVNGVRYSTGPFGINYAAATSGGYRFGSTLAGASFLSGRIAAFGLFNSVLSASDVEDLFDTHVNAPVVNGYTYLTAASASWDMLGADSTTFTLNGSSLADGSKLNVAYRDARL